MPRIVTAVVRKIGLVAFFTTPDALRAEGGATTNQQLLDSKAVLQDAATVVHPPNDRFTHQIWQMSWKSGKRIFSVCAEQSGV